MSFHFEALLHFEVDRRLDRFLGVEGDVEVSREGEGEREVCLRVEGDVEVSREGEGEREVCLTSRVLGT